MKPKVSIIVPIYNAELYIKDTVVSIQQQTLLDIEIILVDDGSTDRSGAICELLCDNDKRITVIHIQNSGVSEARNKGIEIAKGDFIGFVDADDLIEKDMYEILYNNAIKSQADISMISPVITELNGQNKYYYNTKKIYEWNTNQALEKFFQGNIIDIAVYTKLIKRDICQKIKFPVKKSMHEDKMFVYLSIKNSQKIVFEDICKYHYIKRKNSLSTSKFNKKWFDSVEIANNIVEDVKKSKYRNLENNAYTDMYITKLLVLRNIYRDSNAMQMFNIEKQKLIKEIKNINLKKLKKYFSKQKLIEIYVIRNFQEIYSLVVKVFDMFFRK